MTKGINYLFYLKAPSKVLAEMHNPAKSNSELLLPVYFRITVAGKRAEISTGESTLIGNWHQAKGRVKGTGEKAHTINARLDSFLNDAKKACQYLTDRNKLISAVIIKNQILGIGPNCYGLVQCFENFVREITLKIGSDYEVGTLKNYKVTLGHLKEFISKHHHIKDVPLKDLNYKFITDFELMCKTDWDCKRSSTSAKHIQRIRRVIGIALANEWLEKDPFILYKSKPEKPTIKFLTRDELRLIEEKEFSIERLERVRDMFIFSCYTGYAYADVEKFSPNDIVTGMAGLKWIYTGRAKNEGKSNVPCCHRHWQ